MKWNLKSIATLSLFAACSAAFAITIDGTRDAEYGEPLAVQDTQTQFGDSNLGQATLANGSELNGLYIKRTATDLYVFAAGNLESNFNKFELFIDSAAGGQNRLLNGQADTDFGALRRMAEEAPGFGNGLTFDADFEADHWFSMTCGNAFEAYYNYSPIGNNDYSGGYLGTNNGSGPVTGGGAPAGYEGAINNSNIAGVDGGTALTGLATTGLETGVELRIPLSMIGNPTGPIKLMVFVNGGGHDFLSNQVLPGIGGGGNLAEPRTVSFANIPGLQYVTVPGAGGTTVTGKILLNDLDPTVRLTRAVEVEIRNAGDDSLIETKTVYVDANDNYTLSTTATGTANLVFKAKGFLVDRVDGAVLSGAVNANLINGDIDGDNAITVFDYGILSDYFDKSNSDSDWNTVGSNGSAPADADIDGDGAVTVFDYGVLSTNFDLSGD